MYMKVTAKSAALQRAVDFHVILPYHDGYPGPDRPWPVLVFLPGYSGSDGHEIRHSRPCA